MIDKGFFQSHYLVMPHASYRLIYKLIELLIPL